MQDQQRVTLQCPQCFAQFGIGLRIPPPIMVVSLVCHWAKGGMVLMDERPNVATVVDGDLILGLTPPGAAKQVMSLTLGDSIECKNADGSLREEKWTLTKLGTGVWQLSPSLVEGELHAFITLVDVLDNILRDEVGLPGYDETVWNDHVRKLEGV